MESGWNRVREGWFTLSPMTLRPGLSAEVRTTVADEDTAVAMGSGDVAVLATPRLLAWLEQATVRAVDGHLAEGMTSVGTAVEIRHRRPTAVGATVTAIARLTEVDGARLVFRVEAVEGGRTIGEGTVRRAVAERSAFDVR